MEIHTLDHKSMNIRNKLSNVILVVIIIMVFLGCGQANYVSSINVTDFFTKEEINIPIEGMASFNGEYATSYLSNCSKNDLIEMIIDCSTEDVKYNIKYSEEEAFVIEIKEKEEVHFVVCSQRVIESDSLYSYEFFDMTINVYDCDDEKALKFIWAFPLVDDTTVYWDVVETGTEYITKYQLQDFKEYYQYILDNMDLSGEIEAGDDFIIVPEQFCQDEENSLKFEFYNKENIDYLKVYILNN